MAGIGFELRKLYNQEGILAKPKAYAYAGIVYTGPMVLGILLTVSIVVLSMLSGMSESERNYLLSNLTYAIIFSLIVSTLLSLVLTRYVADLILEEKLDLLLPSFYGSSIVLLLIGSPLFGLYLLVASRDFFEGILTWLLFGELCIAWNAIIYLTAIKSYRKIIRGFLLAIGFTLLAGSIGLLCHIPYTLFASVCVGYGVMIIWMLRLIQQSFPSDLILSFDFLKWFDRFGDLAKGGIYMMVGLFAHIIINWFGPIGRSQDGFFQTAPVYDVPAMFAYLTTLVSTLTFVMSVEISFYPKFKKYFNLYNQQGSLAEIEEAEVQMLDTMQDELKYVFWKQLLASLFFMGVGSVLLAYLPIGFSNQMKGYFLTLCLAYGLYAVGNVNLLMSIYLTNYKGFKKVARYFALLSISLSVFSQFFDTAFLGFGFLVASIVLFIESSRELDTHISDLSYHFLGSQKMVVQDKGGYFESLAMKLDHLRKE